MSYSIVDDAYGKTNVKLLHVHRDGALHTIQELEVNTHLTLATKKDYTDGDNSDIIATDSQKNTVYLLARKHGVSCPEAFAVILCKHFIETYPHVVSARVYIEQYPWRRAVVDGKEHNHAFVFTPVATRFCEARLDRDGEPRVEAGIKGLRVLKTTKSAFVNFIDDDYRTLPDAHDRVFSTIVTARWKYSCNKLNFCSTWNRVKEIIINTFTGPAETGVFSPSVQNTLYFAERTILDDIPEISHIDIELPNVHYINVDLSRFPRIGYNNNNRVLQPMDKPSGNIHAALARNPKAKL